MSVPHAAELLRLLDELAGAWHLELHARGTDLADRLAIWVGACLFPETYYKSTT